MPPHNRHIHTRISLRSSGSRLPAPPHVHHCGSATPNRWPLVHPARAGIAESADAAAFCAPCWPPLAEPGGFSSSCTRMKLLMHFPKLISAHADRGDTFGVSREDDARRARARPSARDRKRIGGSGAAAHGVELSIAPELTWMRRISGGGAARTSRAPPPGDHVVAAGTPARSIKKWYLSARRAGSRLR